MSNKLLLIVLLLNGVSFSQPDTLWTKTFGGASKDYYTAIDSANDEGFVVAVGSMYHGTDSATILLNKIDGTGNILWSKLYQDTGPCYGNDVQKTNDGGYIIVGSNASFSGDIGYEIWLIKTDALGDTVWTKIFGGNGHDGGYSSVRQTSDGGYIIVATMGNKEVWLIKTNANGDTTWIKTFGGNSNDADYGNSVQQTNDGGFIICGSTTSYQNSNGLYDVWLIKTNSSGDTTWTKTYGGIIGHDRGKHVQQTSDGGYIVTGNSNSFGSGGIDIWIVKTNTIGDTLWTKTVGGYLSDDSYSVQETRSGDFILAGKTESFGSGSFDVWVIKIDNFGNNIWTKTIGGNGDDWGESILQTSDGGLIIAGRTTSYGSGQEDAWLIKLDRELNNGLVWHISTTGSDATGDGSAILPYSSIQYGIDQSINGDTILVQPGTYEENINFNGKNIVVGSLTLTTGDTSYISQTIIDGNQAGSVVIFESNEDSTATLIGLTLTDGIGNPIDVYYQGGGIYCTNSSPSLINLRIINNSISGSIGQGHGGGIYFNNSNSIVTNSTISNNTSNGDGGGIYCQGVGDIEISNVLIEGNTALWNSGAGIYSNNTDISLYYS